MTSDLEGRIYEHRERLIESFTKRYQCTKLIYYEDYPDPDSAIDREKQLKGWRREKKIALIQKRNPRWIDLWDEITFGFDTEMLNHEKQVPFIIKEGPRKQK